jgi:hypothetical protein
LRSVVKSVKVVANKKSHARSLSHSSEFELFLSPHRKRGRECLTSNGSLEPFESGSRGKAYALSPLEFDSRRSLPLFYPTTFFLIIHRLSFCKNDSNALTQVELWDRLLGVYG